MGTILSLLANVGYLLDADAIQAREDSVHVRERERGGERKRERDKESRRNRRRENTKIGSR